MSNVVLLLLELGLDISSPKKEKFLCRYPEKKFSRSTFEKTLVLFLKNFVLRRKDGYFCCSDGSPSLSWMWAFTLGGVFPGTPRRRRCKVDQCRKKFPSMLPSTKDLFKSHLTIIKNKMC